VRVDTVLGAMVHRAIWSSAGFMCLNARVGAHHRPAPIYDEILKCEARGIPSNQGLRGVVLADEQELIRRLR